MKTNSRSCLTGQSKVPGPSESWAVGGLSFLEHCHSFPVSQSWLQAPGFLTPPTAQAIPSSGPRPEGLSPEARDKHHLSEKTSSPIPALSSPQCPLPN